MSTQLTFGGSSVQLARDVGTPAAVEGFYTDTITQGPKLSVGLSTVYIFQAYENPVQLMIDEATKKLFINVAGVWLEATPWVNVAGVWQVATPWVNVAGVWQ